MKLTLKFKYRVAFISPDYHCSFIYAENLLNKNIYSKIYIPPNYPTQLLYSKKNTIINNFNGIPIIRNVINFIISLYLLSFNCHICYGSVKYFYFGENFLHRIGLISKDTSIYLKIAKLLKIKIIYVPSGCHDEDLKINFMKFDNGNICNNCGSFEKCNDKDIIKKLNYVNKYSDLNIGMGCFQSKYIELTHLPYKVIDLKLWNPKIIIPNKFLINKKSDATYILHSFFDKDRIKDDKNDKGSQYIKEAVERLINEGFKIEYIYLNNVKSNEMRFYQSQADIIVEQLIYGWWGSTGVEAMALGKPTVCYIRDDWKKYFLNIFKNYKDIPVVNANTDNIYDVLKLLITDHKYRKYCGEMSRKFAEIHFNPQKNIRELFKLIQN